MLSIHNVEVYGLKQAVISSRNAMRLELPDNSDEEFDQSLQRASLLVQASNNDEHVKCHDNYLTTVVVQFDLVYTQYITKQFQRYHFFQYGSSSSLMHRITKMDFTKCCNKYVSLRTRLYMKELVDEYHRILDNQISDMYFELVSEETQLPYSVHATTFAECKYYQFMRIVSECPMGTELFVHVSTNYKQLQTIYWQRRNHKLKEDWGAFCDFVKSLPYAQELIIGQDD